MKAARIPPECQSDIVAALLEAVADADAVALEVDTDGSWVAVADADADIDVLDVAVPVRIVKDAPDVAVLERSDFGGSTPYVLRSGTEVDALIANVLSRGLSVLVAAVASGLIVTGTLKMLHISAMAA